MADFAGGAARSCSCTGGNREGRAQSTARPKQLTREPRDGARGVLSMPISAISRRYLGDYLGRRLPHAPRPHVDLGDISAIISIGRRISHAPRALRHPPSRRRNRRRDEPSSPSTCPSRLYRHSSWTACAEVPGQPARPAAPLALPGEIAISDGDIAISDGEIAISDGEIAISDGEIAISDGEITISDGDPMTRSLRFRMMNARS